MANAIPLGVEGYERILRAEGLVQIGEAVDEGENYYCNFSK